MNNHDTTFWLQLDADFYNLASENPRVRSVKAVALTQKRPRSQRPGTVLVKLTVRVPEAAFLPLRPEAIVVIPEGMTITEPIEVEAGDPT